MTTNQFFSKLLRFAPVVFFQTLMVISTANAEMVEDPAAKNPDAFQGKVFNLGAAEIKDHNFKPHEMPFDTKSNDQSADMVYSKKFFVVILGTGKRCAFKEVERARIQRRIPTNKVFFENYKCEDGAVQNYSNMNADRSFIAVHGGKTREEARALYERERLKDLFLGSYIHQMRAIRHAE